MVVALVCVFIKNAKIKLSENHRTKARNVLITAIIIIGVMAMFRTTELLACHAQFPDIYQPYIMNYYPFALWALISVLMYNVYHSMFLK